MIIFKTVKCCGIFTLNVYEPEFKYCMSGLDQVLTRFLSNITYSVQALAQKYA